jgi:O-antigen/teichoic acid export membrane protein
MPELHRHYLSTLATNGAILVFGMVSGILSARLLGPQGRGELAVILLWPMALATLGGLGLNQAITFFVAREPERLHALFTVALVLSVAQGLLLGVLGYVLLPYVLQGKAPDVLYWSRWFLLSIPLVFLSGNLQNLLQGSMHLDHYNAGRMFSAAWYALVMAALYLLHRPSLGDIITWLLVGYAGGVALSLVLVRRLLRPRWHWDSSILRPLLSYGVKTQLGGVTYYLNQRLDQLNMSVWLAPEALGYYVVAVALASPLTIIPNAIGIVTLPAAAREAAAAARTVIRRSLRTVLLLGAMGAAVLFLLVPYLLPLLFGEAFRPAIGACRVLAIAMVPLGLSLVLYESLRALNHPLAPAFAEGLGNLVTIALLAVLLPRYSFLGAAYASLGAYTAVFLATAYFAQTRAGLSVARLLWPSTSTPAGS